MIEKAVNPISEGDLGSLRGTKTPINSHFINETKNITAPIMDSLREELREMTGGSRL